MANIIQLVDKSSGKVFRGAINTNFNNLNTEVETMQDSVAMLESDAGIAETDISALKSDNTKQKAAIKVLQDTLGNISGGYNNILVTTSNSEQGTAHLPDSSTATSVTLVGNEVFEATTKEMNDAITNIIKGDYIKGGEGVAITKEEKGITISLVPTGSTDGNNNSVNKDWQHSNPNLLINSDWRHPSSHRNTYTFVKTTDETETEAKPCIDCWEINYSSSKNMGYTFYDAEENKFVAFQGQSPTDPGNLDSYATLSQSFPDNWGDFLIGKKMVLSVAVSTSYSDYQSGIIDIHSYSFTATQGYTGWMQFENLPAAQFGIHFNTEIGNRIENEITVRFNNIWVYAWKLEVGETSTLGVDLLKPCDYYGQARECEKYIQSIVSNGTDIATSFYPVNFTPVINENSLLFEIPVWKPFMKQPTLSVFDINGSAFTGNAININVNGVNFESTENISLSIARYNPGSHMITISTNVTSEQLFSTATIDDISKMYSLTVSSDKNIVLSCEETYNS